MTLEKARVDIGKSEKFTGITYVGFSRVRKLQDLIVEPMTLERLQCIKYKDTFLYRVLEEKRLDELAEITISKEILESLENLLVILLMLDSPE